MTLEAFLQRFSRVVRSQSSLMVQCPAHEDATASLSLTSGEDGRILLHCHAGCAPQAIVTAMGLSMPDLFPASRHTHEAPQAMWDYQDEEGRLLYQVCRFPNKPDGTKVFAQRRPDGVGGWVWKIEGVRRVLYRLPKLKGHLAVTVVEGEKDADRLWGLGIPATTNAGGAGKWKDDYVQQLLAAGVQRVAVLADNDHPGEAHARMVGRTCDDAKLLTRVILLPGLGPKQDVSDWLDAGHTKAELLEVIRNAPPFQSRIHPVSAPLKIELTSLSDLLAEPEEAVAWLVQDRVPSGSIILFVGKPKAGKSTVVRGLAHAVATGTCWLGHRVTAGPVWYLALEDKRSEVRRHFRQMGATGKEPIWVLAGDVPGDILPLLHARATSERPALIIVDTLQRMLRVKDMSDYAEVTNAFGPVLGLARQTGSALLLVHHARKSGEGMDSILGSTALAGSVDNMFLLVRTDSYRALSSVQRIGKDLDPLVVDLDEQTGHMKILGTKREVEERQTGDLILEVLSDETTPQTESWVKGQVEGVQARLVSRSLRMLLRTGRVLRTGAGKRGNPYLYRPLNSSYIPEYPVENAKVARIDEGKLWVNREDE